METSRLGVVILKYFLPQPFASFCPPAELRTAIENQHIKTRPSKHRQIFFRRQASTCQHQTPSVVATVATIALLPAFQRIQLLISTHRTSDTYPAPGYNYVRVLLHTIDILPGCIYQVPDKHIQVSRGDKATVYEAYKVLRQ